MPTQQRFEGPTLEAVLEDVRATVGDAAVITAANKLRKGGLGGFFAKEAFEVLVDVDDDGTDELPPAAETAHPKPLSLLELAESVSNEEARAALDSNPLEFDAVLNEVIRAEAPSARRTRPLVAQRTIAERAVTESRHMAEPTRLPEPVMFDEPMVFDEPMRLPEPVHMPQIPMPEPTRMPEPCDPKLLVDLGLPDQLARGLARAHDPMHSIAAALAHLPRPEPLPVSAGSVIAVVGERPNALDLANAIAKELGLGRDAVVLASSSGRTTRSTTANRVSSPQEAFDSRRSWRRRKTPTVVAIECQVGLTTTAWAEHVLDALEPAMTWATVDAHRKPEDVSHWAQRLGGVDALAVCNLHETSSPAAVLHTGIPIGFLDGHDASPDTWARLLSERIAA